MCGALHICWQAKDITVDGQYMVCLLYQDVLCLAEAGKFDPIYTIMACINLNGAKIEDVDNGRGKATAVFSLSRLDSHRRRSAMPLGTILLEVGL